MHQLLSFFDLGLIVTEFSRDDLHSAGDLFLQAGLTLTFSTSLATGGPLDSREVLGLVTRSTGLIRLRTGGLWFRCDGLIREVLWQTKEVGSNQQGRIGDWETEKGRGADTLSNAAVRSHSSMALRPKFTPCQ